MSTKRNPKKGESKPKEKPKTAEELASEDLDQVVGGTGLPAPTLPQVSKEWGAAGKFEKWGKLNPSTSNVNPSTRAKP